LKDPDKKNNQVINNEKTSLIQVMYWPNTYLSGSRPNMVFEPNFGVFENRLANPVIEYFYVTSFSKIGLEGKVK
jgi:hypothetical protein